ncbi:MAG: hypothetical protein ACK43N_06470, partial [Pirellulaceae bacterium]
FPTEAVERYVLKDAEDLTIRRSLWMRPVLGFKFSFSRSKKRKRLRLTGIPHKTKGTPLRDQGALFAADAIST